MCFSACHWARLARIVYGASIADAQHAGFNELSISNHQMKQLGRSPLDITPGLLQPECTALFQEWLSQPTHRVY
jgi:tRNA(Arg) A34 adenosine deaminase TadA